MEVKNEPKRETWSKQIDFLLALIGFSVGLGNVWRFPYLCYKNGGGAFLIPYFMCVVIGGFPLLFLEISIGQFMSKGGTNAWDICPIFKGVGWATTMIVFFVNIYYNVILTWAFYYFLASFTTKLPWDTCDNYWNTEHCYMPGQSNNFTQSNHTQEIVKYSNVTNTTLRVNSVTEFWENKVLGISDGISEMGPLKWDVTLCLLLSWTVVYLCISKGIKSSGKVVYFTATAPYVFMFILLIRGVTLPGSLDGILFYVVPDFKRLTDIQVWVDAGTQVFFSYAIALGGLTSLGSYNEFNHNSFRDAIMFTCCNSGTSIFAGFVIFSVLGFMANEQGVNIQDVAESGPGLAFVAYPRAVSEMPVAPLWSALFFFMIILLGLDSQFVGVEGLVTAILDTFPWLRIGKRKMIFILVACIVQFLLGLPMTTYGGMYVFQLFDYYPASRIVVFVGFLEAIVVAWIYGVNRYYDNIEMMMGFKLSPWLKICWAFLTPVYTFALFTLSAINYSTLTYNRPSGTYVFPGWAVGIGWALATIPIVFFLGTGVYKVIQYLMIGKPLRDLIRPEGLKEHQLRPQDKKVLHLPEQVTNGQNWGNGSYKPIDPEKGYHEKDVPNTV